MNPSLLDIRPRIADAQRAGQPVVALESTLIAHGLPWPDNLDTALQAEQSARNAGAIPATIAVLDGRPTVGLNEQEIERLARASGIRKASSRDLAPAIAQKASAATTVAATMLLAHRAEIRIFATGGLGGVHPPRDGSAFDVSADLMELARTPVAVVCAGAKSILDLSATLEVLETYAVPVLGYKTDTFPAFYLRSSGLPVSARVDSPAEAAAVLKAHWALTATGVVLAQPLPETEALQAVEFNAALAEAQARAHRQRISGPALTPFLLNCLAELTDGRTLRANRALILANARLAAAVACELIRE